MFRQSGYRGLDWVYDWVYDGWIIGKVFTKNSINGIRKNMFRTAWVSDKADPVLIG